MVWVVSGYDQADDVVGPRDDCSMCHTPQAENARVLRNRFERVEGRPAD
jgi:nitrate reductase cytochrome c-type subunit